MILELKQVEHEFLPIDPEDQFQVQMAAQIIHQA